MRKNHNDSPFKPRKPRQRNHSCCDEGKEPPEVSSEQHGGVCFDAQREEQTINGLFSRWLAADSLRDGSAQFHGRAAWQLSADTLNRQLGNSIYSSDPPENKPDQRAAAKLDTLEQAFSAWRQQADYLGDQGQAQSENLSHLLSLLNEAEIALFNPDDQPYKTLPSFPRYLYLLSHILQENVRTGALDEDAAMIEDYLQRAEAYLDGVMVSAFEDRRGYIHWYQNGPRKELVYIYDEFTAQSLTEWAPLSNEVAAYMAVARDVLRDRIADAWVAELHIEEMQAALAQVFSASEMPLSWAQRREQLIYLEKHYLAVPDSAAAQSSDQQAVSFPAPQMPEVYGLILPDIRARYLPGVSARSPERLFVSQPRWEDIFPDNGEYLTRMIMNGMVTNMMRGLMGAAFPATIAGGGLLGAVAPMIHMILGLFWPKPKAITMQQVIKEIELRLNAALTEHYINDLLLKFRGAAGAYESQMQVLEDLNKGNDDKATWSMGDFQRWQSVFDQFYNLTLHMYDNKYNFQYQVSQIFPSFATLAMSVLSGAILTYKKGDNISFFISRYEYFLNGWYEYMQRLMEQSWNNINRVDTKNLDRFKIGSNWHVVDLYSRNKLGGFVNTYYLTQTHLFQHLSPAMDMFKVRVKMWLTNNSGLRALCQAYDATASAYNRAYGKSLPSNSVAYIYDFVLGDAWYAAGMNHHQAANQLENVDGGGAYYKQLYPALENVYIRFGRQAKRNDCFMGITTNQPYPARRYYGPGDYADLATRNEDGSVIEWTGYQFTCPRGYFVVLYSEINFGEYKDPGSDVVKYRGTSRDLPNYLDIEQSFPEGIKAKSMKVRIDVRYWQAGTGRPYNRLGRVQFTEWADITTPDGKLTVLKDIAQADMDNS
ncbi:hypothetical protein [Pantoea sp. B65]|uniref:hypothetical protein n=1 Tax=Pantoea sp. B65 TaxID=2813359 RepID=UPI0039B4AA25